MDKSVKKHILVISQYFFPEQFRINDICSEWVKRGYKVTVITGIPNYPQGKFFEGYGFFKKQREVYNGIEIIRIPILPRGKSAITLALNYISFVVSGFFWQIFTRIKADNVFIFEVSPMTQALPGVWYAKKHSIPCFLYVQDLWPENLEIVANVKNKHVLRMVSVMVDYIYKNCTKIFTTSESFVQAIQKRGVAIEKLCYWPQYAEDYFMPMTNSKLSKTLSDGIFNVIFTGNIGVTQGLDILLETAQLLQQNCTHKVVFNIVGDGRYKDEFVSKVFESKLNHMFNFIEKQPITQIPSMIAANDVAFLSLINNPLFDMTIPAKLQTYLACGTPIVASAAGETAKIIRESDAGLCSKPGDAQALANNIVYLSQLSKQHLNQLGVNARTYFEAHFSKSVLLDQMDKYFNEY